MAVNKREALASVREDDIKYDPWGTCMMHWFGISETLYWETGEVPADWEYSPGMAGEPSDEPPGTDYAEALKSGRLTVADLTYAGNVLSRWSHVLERAGRDY